MCNPPPRIFLQILLLVVCNFLNIFKSNVYQTATTVYVIAKPWIGREKFFKLPPDDIMGYMKDLEVLWEDQLVSRAGHNRSYRVDVTSCRRTPDIRIIMTAAVLSTAIICKISHESCQQLNSAKRGYILSRTQSSNVVHLFAEMKCFFHQHPRNQHTLL